MTISSRTPEGRPNRCPVCQHRLRVSPSWPGADAPCPRCGSLLWFSNPNLLPSTTQSLQEYTLDDFNDQITVLRQSGIRGFLQLVGLSALPTEDARELARIQGIVRSMTAAERSSPDIIDEQRRKRIAAGSGVALAEVDNFLAQFQQVRTLMRRVAGQSIYQRLQQVYQMRFRSKELEGGEAEA